MKEKIHEQIDAMAPELITLANRIFDRPELGGQEFFASSNLCALLEQNGFQIEKGVGGFDTSFRAVFSQGEGGPRIGMLCEYDALANLGHACGHHMQGPSVVGAAIAVKKVLKDQPYTLVIYGTPDEEVMGGKILMKEKGCFQDIDIALMMHPSPTTTTDVRCLAMATYRVTFHGVAAHAAIAPEQGRSALDAILLAFHGIEFLREHVLDDTRLHYTIIDAGGAYNIVPKKAVAEICMRSYSTPYLYQVVERIEKIIQGAALMTETTFDIKKKTMFQSKIPVTSLNDLLMENAKLVEAPTIRPPREKTGSTDFGNVMYDVPGSCIRVAFVPEGTSAHSEEYVNNGKTESAHLCMVLGAKILADTCCDLISSPELMQKVLDEFAEKKKEMGAILRTK